MRLSPFAQRYLYLILTPLITFTNTAFSIVCTLIGTFVPIVDALRIAVAGNLSALVGSLPIASVTVFQSFIVIANLTVGNVTSILSTYGCVVTSAIQTTIASFVNAIIGLY